MTDVATHVYEAMEEEEALPGLLEEPVPGQNIDITHARSYIVLRGDIFTILT